MTENILVLSLRSIDKSPAMACVVEFEDVLTREYGADRIDYPAAVPFHTRYTMVFCIGLHFDHLYFVRAQLLRARERGAKVVAYVFDAWNADSYFYNRRRQFKQWFVPDLTLSRFCDRLFVPFMKAANEFRGEEQDLIRYLPLGVDTSLSSGLRSQRSISIFAYGRQPAKYDNYFSENFNDSRGDYIYYNTSHIEIHGINDFHAHRRLFWKIAENSVIALAFDPLSMRNDVPYSFVGQRWFECFAAGCVVAGKQPEADDASVLLGWENATIDIPSTPRNALLFLKEILGDKLKVEEIRERNVAEVRARHDWRHRIDSILSGFA